MISNLISLKTWLYSYPPFSGPWVQQPMSRTTLGWVFNIFITSSSCKQWWWSWRWRWRRWQCSKGISVGRFPKYWRQCRPSHLKKIFPLFFTCGLLQSLHRHSTCALQKRCETRFRIIIWLMIWRCITCHKIGFLLCFTFTPSILRASHFQTCCSSISIIILSSPSLSSLLSLWPSPS